MKYAGLKENDVVDCLNGICVSVWVQGCPHRCVGCHNPQTWGFDGGIEIEEETLIQNTIDAIQRYNIHRDLSILGGEPLAPSNKQFTARLIQRVNEECPNSNILLWTGYTIEELNAMNDRTIKYILKHIDVLIEGRFVLAQRDITLPLRGSTNQRIFMQEDLQNLT